MDRSGALSPDVIRIDLHCHSLASNRPSDAVLRALKCPESYSEPGSVYAQAKARGMSFVTITDHDSIEGVKTIADREDVIIGEELSCRFPEDGCLMHVLVWGLSAEDHFELQNRAKDIYREDQVQRPKNPPVLSHAELVLRR